MSISGPFFFSIDPYSSFYALFVANLVSHNSFFLYRPKTQNAHGGRNITPRCLSEGVDIFLKSAERQGGANRTFATGGRCHGWQLEPCPYGLEPLLTFRQKIPTGRPYIEEGHSVRHGRSWICFTNSQFTCLVQLFMLQSSDNLQKYEIINNIYL